MPKRKAKEVEAGEAGTPDLRRSSRRKTPSTNDNDANASHSARETLASKATNFEMRQTEPSADKITSKSQVKKTIKKPAAAPSATSSAMKGSSSNSSSRDGKSYWLMKAEPETRFENGVDVRFSIDDLASRTEPEPWDGIRAYAARNNLRAMKKGELAFFYHSNCKEPGIVGTMEIVQEHSPDLSAHDPKAPYYDASSKPDDPKWSVVHVKFRSKFAQQIGLKELREMGKPGRPLENMQMLKQSRLSVSRVGLDEWDYLMSVVKERSGEVR